MIRYLQNSIENMRDIGGYKSGLENRVKIGRLIRSNLPRNLSNSDISVLNRMGINTVIDLRSQEEIETRKSVFEDNKNFKYNYSKEILYGRVFERVCREI